MNNRIKTLFANKKERILSLYFTAGYPNLEDTLPLIQGLEQAGVDLLEIGFPFSDPLADGPVIQESSQKAIENGMTLDVLFNQLENLRAETDIPIILMGYLNPILQYGEERFVESCYRVGVDGIIVPDMPIHYFNKKMKDSCLKHNLLNILLVTPETSEDRIRFIDEESTGFIYLVSSNSITGSKNNNSLKVEYFERIQSMNLKNPTLIGFGIHDEASFNLASQYSRGAIIGSAFIRHITENGTDLHSLQSFVKQIRK